MPPTTHDPARQRLGIDSQTVFGLSPPDHLALAAQLGCGHISIGLEPVPWKLADVEPWSLRTDRTLRSQLGRVAADSGVRLAVGEGFAFRKNTQAFDFRADLDIMAELQVESVSTCGLDPASESFLEQLAIFADLTMERGLGLLVEFAPPHALPDFRSALAAVMHLDRPHVSLVIDSMHFLRGHNTIDELLAASPRWIGRAQLSDAVLNAPPKDYIQEACFERLLPGAGDLPLLALIDALPAETQIGLEIPNRARASDRANLVRFIGEAVALTAALCSSDG
jgi:sugar phosphate isomerase/epimerase